MFDHKRNTALFTKFREFVQSLQKKDKIALLFHRDCDGISSALITNIAIEQIHGFQAKFGFSLDYHEFGKLIPKLKAKKINKVILVDMGVDGKKEIIADLEACLEGLMVIDHHKVYADMNSDKTVFIKSQFFSDLDGSKYPATKLCFDLFSQLTDLQKIRTIACIGLLGDMGYDQWKTFFDQTEKETGQTKEDLAKLTELVASVETVWPRKFNNLYKHLLKSKDPVTLWETKYAKCLIKLRQELDKLFLEFNVQAERFPGLDLIFFNLTSDYNIKTAIANKISVANPDQTVLIFETLGKNTHFSGRRQDFKVKMNELIEACIRDIPESSGGGHIPAAAGGIPSKYLDQFKENIKQYLKQNYKK